MDLRFHIFQLMCIYQSPIPSAASNTTHPYGRPLTYYTVAHVIPQGLGYNRNTFPAGVLCDRCNKYFGRKLEPALIMHPTLAYDMQRLSVPGKDGGPRPILGNWERASDGSVLVPMAPPQDWGQHRGAPHIGLLPILDPNFDQLLFRRALHLLAFNVLAFLHGTRQAPGDAAYDPRDARYSAVRTYIRAPRRRTDAWPFLERYDRPAVGGKVEVHLSNWDGVLIGRIRAYSFEFYVDLMNTGRLLAFAGAEGIRPVRLIPEGTRFPASPTMQEVPPENRWWLRLSDGKIQIGTPWESRTA